MMMMKIVRMKIKLCSKVIEKMDQVIDMVMSSLFRVKFDINDKQIGVILI